MLEVATCPMHFAGQGCASQLVPAHGRPALDTPMIDPSVPTGNVSRGASLLPMGMAPYL